MKLKEIIKTQNDILEDGHQINNDIIRDVDINIIAHFGNLVSFDVFCDNCAIIHGYNNTKNIGWIIKAFVELFDIGKEDGLLLTRIQDIPCRVISDGYFTKILGFGHFMKDKFVYTEDFMKITE